MPSADSRYALGSPCGSLTRGFCMLPHPFFVFLTFMVRLVRGQDAGFPDAGDFVHRFSLYSGLFADAIPSETQRASRGKPRLLSAHDCQIYVVRPYDGYRTLSCVADSSRPYPASNLPALYLLCTGHTCTSTHAFASGFLQAHITVIPLPLATLRLRQPGSGLCPIYVS